MLHIKNIFLSYKDPILKGISFELKSGEIMGLVGKSGAGKSSLLKIIADTVNDLASRRRWEIRPVGSMELLPKNLVDQLNDVASKTKGIKGVVINVAIGYGGRSEIADAVKSLITSDANLGKSAAEIANSISVEEISRHLYTAGLPDPDLVIRTSGEQRLGGFLLWQSAQSEYYFCEAYWPDFRRVDFLRALRSYSTRHRRLGK